MGLKSSQWGNNKRIKLAATMPYMSLHTGQYKDADMGEPVQILSQSLKLIENFSHQFPPRLLPHPGGPYGPPGIQWGPFDIPTMPESFSDMLRVAVMRFQKQAGDLDVDGKAGINTLHRLDELLVYLEHASTSSSNFAPGQFPSGNPAQAPGRSNPNETPATNPRRR